MKLFVAKNSRLPALLRNLVLGALSCLLISSVCEAQILYVIRDTTTSLASYDIATGAVVNPSLITGLSAPYSVTYSGGSLYIGSITAGDARIGKYNLNGTAVSEYFISGIRSAGIAVSGSNLYATDFASGTVGQYDTITGAPINTSLIAGLGGPRGITLDSAGNMYIANTGLGTVSKYSANGTLIDAEFIKDSATSSPFGIAIDEAGNIFVANFGNNNIGKYNISTGVYSYFISGLNAPSAVAYLDGKLYVADYNSGVIGTYDATTGAAIDPENWITGVQGVTGIALIPEGSTVALLALGGVGLILLGRKRKLTA